VLIELGANDGLRGLPVEMTEANLLAAIARARDSGARVLVAGMKMPPNYGEDYTRDFAKIFPRVASETGSALVPFLLEGVAADPELNQADGIHPNAEGHRRIAEALAPLLVEALGVGEAEG
jgi:acyl-CoA thioesterase-1